MTKDFDLIYVEGAEGRTMTLVLLEEGKEPRNLGPFPAKESGPKFIDALLEHFGSIDRKRCELAYMAKHFVYLNDERNGAGQSYPYRVG